MTTWFDKDGPCGGLSLDDRGLQYGDGLFETIAVRDGVPRLWDRHMHRLASSCRRLSLPFPGEDSLRILLQAAIDGSAATASDATAKLIVTAGVGERGYARPKDVSPTVVARIFPATPVPRRHYDDGVDVQLCDTRIAEQPALAGLKTLNRLEQVLARQALDAAFEGLMSDGAKRAICGTMSNVFIVTGQEIVTPSLHRCGVEGVTRAEILDRARAESLQISTRDVPLVECLQADELILSNSQFGVLPARRLHDRVFAQRAGYQRLRDLLADAGFREWAA